MTTTDTDIIIIKGAPATGKSDTSKDLSKYFPKGVRIEVDNLRSMVISVDWTNQAEHINILGTSTKLVSEFYNLGFKPIIVIDTFSGDKLDLYYEKLMAINDRWIIKAFGLFTSEQELKNRLDKRSDNKFKDIIITKQLNEDTIKYKHSIEFQIDTTNLKSEETARIIYEEITVNKAASKEDEKKRILHTDSQAIQ